MKTVIIYIALVALGMAISGAYHTLMDGRVICFTNSWGSKENRKRSMNAKVNKLTKNFIESTVKTSVYYHSDSAYALEMASKAVKSASDQIREQQRER